MAVPQNKKKSAELEIYFTLNTETSLEQFQRTLRKIELEIHRKKQTNKTK